MNAAAAEVFPLKPPLTRKQTKMTATAEQHVAEWQAALYKRDSWIRTDPGRFITPPVYYCYLWFSHHADNPFSHYFLTKGGTLWKAAYVTRIIFDLWRPFTRYTNTNLTWKTLCTQTRRAKKFNLVSQIDTAAYTKNWFEMWKRAREYSGRNRGAKKTKLQSRQDLEWYTP